MNIYLLIYCIFISHLLQMNCCLEVVRKYICCCDRFKKCYKIDNSLANIPCHSNELLDDGFKGQYSYLKNIEYSDTVGFVPPIIAGKVIKVYDGDTITIASRLSSDTAGPIYRYSVRLNGIDAPEIKGKTMREKELAIDARDALHGVIFGKMVHLRNIGTEKYGRLLADVYLNDMHINEWLLTHKYAVEYDGGTKHRPKEWDA
jgi:endonuclease YncB( thermonuclease family)